MQQFKSEAKLPSFRNKKILILGLGLNQGGVGSAKFFAEAGAKVKVTDLKDKETLKPSLDLLKDYPEIEYVLGKHSYEDLDWADLIIRNPALKPDNPYLKYGREKGKQVEMDMGIFLQFVKPEQIIGITGTKGKSTTASLIYQALSFHLQGGITNLHLGGVTNVILAGNIGKSVLDTIPHIKKDTLVILELSSFQLSAFGEHQVSPKYAIITNIFPDHLNYYGSMEAYIQDKKYIAQFQRTSDFLFLKKGDQITNSSEFLAGLKGQINYFSGSDLPKNFYPKLPGEHNLENMAAALKVSNTILGLASQGVTLEAMKNFQGVEFRLQLIYDKGGIKIYNDTTATNPDAAIQALKSLPGSILIAGGMNKNLDYQEFVKAIDQYAKAVYFLEGDATEEIKDVIANASMSLRAKQSNLSANSAKGPLSIRGTYNDLEKLLADVKNEAKPGDVILFSPGATSFNLFQNEFDRGRKFNAAVEKIFANRGIVVKKT